VVCAEVGGRIDAARVQDRVTGYPLETAGKALPGSGPCFDQSPSTNPARTAHNCRRSAPPRSPRQWLTAAPAPRRTPGAQYRNEVLDDHGRYGRRAAINLETPSWSLATLRFKMANRASEACVRAMTRTA
jgi:hypothetical protein